MNEGQIREDIEHLRSVCLKSAQDDGKNKFKKVKVDWYDVSCDAYNYHTYWMVFKHSSENIDLLK